MPRRILISVTNDLCNDQRVHRVAMSLHNAGHEVCLIGRRMRSSPPLVGRPYATARMRLFFVSGKFFYLEFAFRLFWRLLFSRGEIHYANDLDTLLPNYLAARLRGRKLVYDTHEYWTEVPELVDRRVTRAVWLWLERRLFPRVDVAMTVNASIAEIYREKYGLAVGVVRNLPQRWEGKRWEGGKSKIVMYQGALNVGRGIELMIEAMRYMPDYSLWIAGRGDLDEPLRRLAAARPYADRISFLGHLDAPALRQQTQQARLGLSLEEDRGASYHFALPNKLFDYLQAGVPVLVSDLPEMKAVVQQYGVGEVLETGERTAEKLAQRLLGICEDVDKLERFSLACQKAAIELCWEEEEKMLYDLLDSVL